MYQYHESLRSWLLTQYPSSRTTGTTLTSCLTFACLVRSKFSKWCTFIVTEVIFNVSLWFLVSSQDMFLFLSLDTGGLPEDTAQVRDCVYASWGSWAWERRVPGAYPEPTPPHHSFNSHFRRWASLLTNVCHCLYQVLFSGWIFDAPRYLQ